MTATADDEQIGALRRIQQHLDGMPLDDAPAQRGHLITENHFIPANLAMLTPTVPPQAVPADLTAR